MNICEQQFGFMQRRRSTDKIFALKRFLENREGQKELHSVSLDLKNDRILREELLGEKFRDRI